MAEAPGTNSVGGTSKDKAPLHVKELGLTQIDGHPKDYDFIADVVFVHGLQGHPKRTWQSNSSAKSSQPLHKRLLDFRTLGKNDQQCEAHGRLFWPADIFPHDFDNVRILTYGYDSKVTKAFKNPTSKNGIFQHGRSFLGALSRVRVDCSGRPIIVVAHSLGGLVAKQALIEARNGGHDPSFFDIYKNTHAVIFFGTPHRGPKFVSWGLWLSGIAKASQMDTNDAILADLKSKSGSSKLEELRLDFDNVLRDSQRPSELRVFSFQEEQGMTGVISLGSKVVPDESSSLDSRKYGTDTINANHIGMCRFEDENDDGYEKFRGVFANFIAEIKNKKQNAMKLSSEGHVHRAALLGRLDYAERQSREHQLRNIDAKEESLSWIWSPSTSFTDWLSSSNGIFWISGKPGSGKSTLVDYLTHNDRIVSKMRQCSAMDWIVLRFFFDFRGRKGVTNSFEGLLRSLLYQLVEAMPHTDVLDLKDDDKVPIFGWPEHRLRDALRISLASAKNGVCILVDGLDEYEGSVLTVIQFLKTLATSKDSQEAPVKICVSSRPEPVPSQLLQHFPHMSMSDHNTLGIRSHCLLVLEELEPVVREGLDTLRLSRIVAQRAEGVFLWARFALTELIRGYSSGETFNEMLERLDSIPNDLEEMYDRMLGRMEPLAKRECMVMLQLVCFAKMDLSWQQHLEATAFAMGKDVFSGEHTYGGKNSANMSKMHSTYAQRVRARAVGFLEFVPEESLYHTKTTSVKLIHRSVSTYLDRKGWQTLGGSGLFNPTRHESWYIKICAEYLRCLLCRLNGENLYDDRWHIPGFRKRQVEASYPFSIYAAQWLFQHAKLLERQGVSSYQLLQDYLTKELIDLHEHCVDVEVSCRCNAESRCELYEDFDPIYAAFRHGLVSYCRNDLESRIPTPGQMFWDRALRCAILSDPDVDDTHECLSLALQNVTTVQQHHIEDCAEITGFFRSGDLKKAEMVLYHESVKNLRLTNSEGQEVKLFWLIGNSSNFSGVLHGRAYLELFVDVAERRGEDLRDPCGPEGNLVETLLKQSPTLIGNDRLQQLRKYYESKSWPFEYNFRGI